MKILHIIEKIEKAAGTTTFCVRAAEELAALGHEVAILVHQINPACDAVPRKGVRVIKYVIGEPLPFEPDIVHFHGIWPPWQHRVQHLIEKCRYPIVLSPHGMLAPWAMAHKRWKKFLPWLIYQKGDVARANCIFTTAKIETEWVCNLGFSNSIVEIPLGTDIEGVNVLASHAKPTKFLCFVGRIYPVKGLDLLIKAWARVKRTVADWHLILIGPDQAGYMKELEKLATSLNLSVCHDRFDNAISSDIAFLGPLYGYDKTRVLLDSRGLLLPSYTENFGGVVVDALALGLPVLASRATPWEVLQDNGCGWQFELTPESLSESLLAFINKTDAERREMGARGRRLVEEKYTWDAIGRDMVKAYEAILSKRI